MTGAIIGAMILVIFGYKFNCMCVDLFSSYKVKEGTDNGTGETAPDENIEDNAKMLDEWSDLIFPIFFYNPLRLVLFLDSEICSRQFFKWNKKAKLTGLPISQKLASYISGEPSPPIFLEKSTQTIYIVNVPKQKAADGSIIPSHLKLVIFGHSGSYLNTMGNTFGARIKHAQIVFLLGLAGIACPVYSSLSFLFCIGCSAASSRLSPRLACST